MSLSQETHHSLKRSHDSFDFDSLVDLEQPFTVPPPADADADADGEANTYLSQPQIPDLDTVASSIPTPPISVGSKTTNVPPSPARSRSASLTDAGSRTPSLRGGSPVPSGEMGGAGAGQVRAEGKAVQSAFTALNGCAAPPAKKVKLSFAEKEMKRIQKEIRERELAEERARKDVEKRKKDAERDAEKRKKDAERDAEKRKKDAERDAEKRKKDAERDAEKRKKDAERDAERRKKDAEREVKRLAQEADKAAKEEKKRRKEEEKAEKLRTEEEKRKKDGTQKTLSSFFAIPASAATRQQSVDRRSESPMPSAILTAAAASPADATLSKKPEKTAYEKAFGDFYVKEHVTVAPTNRFERDEEASQLLSCTIDSYIVGNRSPGRQRGFDATGLFHLSGYEKQRGKRYMPVREIMAAMSGNSTQPIDLTTDSQNTQIRRTNTLLRTIPLKFLKFQEDVRPPYRGTYTSRPVNGMERLARNPLRRDLPDTNYDYDSEAEWVEDDDAEDLNSEGDEDEELGEDGEDMDGFLDDENDEMTNSKRLVLQGDLEPLSTGLCWEDQRKRNTNVKMMSYRMEIILDHTVTTIHPFSTQYWEPNPTAHTTMNPPRFPLNALKPNSLTVNGPSTKPLNPFLKCASDLQKLNTTRQVDLQSQPLSTHPPAVPPNAAVSLSSHSAPTAAPVSAKPRKLVPTEDMDAFKGEIEGSNLSKVGLIEVLKKKFPGRSGAAIKSTLEMVAKRVGSKEVDKRWMLVDDSGAT